MNVPTRLLRCDWPPNEGVMPGSPRFDAILSSVTKDGIREPLTIALDWTVIDGQHRLAAAKRLGIEHIEVQVWTGMELIR